MASGMSGGGVVQRMVVPSIEPFITLAKCQRIYPNDQLPMVRTLVAAANSSTSARISFKLEKCKRRRCVTFLVSVAMMSVPQA